MMCITESSVEEAALAWFSGFSVGTITAFVLRHIAAIRDALLPKPLSGIIRISECERLI